MRFPVLRAALLGLAIPTLPATAQDIDFNQLRQLIEKSRGPKEVSPEQQQLGLINELKIDRSPAGILAVRLAEARLPKEEPPAEPAGEPTPDQLKQRQAAEAQAFARDVVLGRWEQAGTYLSNLPEGIAAKVYHGVVAKIVAPTAMNPDPELQTQGAKPHTQPAFLPPGDWLGLAAAAPKEPDEETLKLLAKLLPKDPVPPQEFFTALEAGIRHFGGKEAADRRRAANLLLEIGLVEQAAPFLPDLAEAKAKPDYPAINLIARHRALFAKTNPEAAGPDAIPQAWELSTSFLTDEKAPPQDRAEALFRALSLIPELGDQRGREWIEKTFANPEGAGLELLATLGTLTAHNQENPDASVRLEQLRLQHAAVRALLDSAVDPAAWSEILTLFARQWQHEAGVTQAKDQSNSRRMVQQYDPWGNPFFVRPDVNFQGDGTRPISSSEMLECQPDEAWLAVVGFTTRHQCLSATARLLLKVKEEDAALPIIRTLAATHPEDAVSMVREVIKVWSENHNPNQDQDYRSRYMYFYGYNNQAGSIPLTRSKQERNLIELAALVKGIRELGLDESFHQEFADAFITCHSQAEVWRVESVESVFGATDVLDSKTLSTLVSRMRLNLAGLWPDPKLQQAYQTNRRDKELQEQIFKGYEAASMVLASALSKEPAESWRLSYQLAALGFEESNYRSTLSPDTDHSAIKRESLEALAASAADYAESLPLPDPDEESAEVFETWFFAALGSPSLEALKNHHVPSPGEYAKIRTALESLPDECAERHLKAMATTLNNRLANVSPDLKLRYLEGATLIVGDRKEMGDASDVFAYYRDLVSEIELSTRIDGSDRVGTGSPFGLHVNLRHTREIEREAGGFQRYLQNQTNAQYSFNFGRPPEDYRDKFEKAARAALEEHFEIVSLTFHGEKVESRTDPEFGWRLTPYAYFLLKPKGPQIDRIPPLKIDLDFMDTSGYVVLPITSPEIPIDASGDPAPRPWRDLRITQTLDDRSLDEEGSLFLEVKATANGLVPPLPDMLDINWDGLEPGLIEDKGIQIAELDGASDDLSPVSTREWRIELKPPGGTLPAKFRFPTAKVDTVEEDGFVLQRYADVDLVPVEGEIALDGSGKSPTPWLAAGLAVAVLGAGGTWIARKRRRPFAVVSEALPLPSSITPVTVLGFLRRLRDREALSEPSRAELDTEIALLESQYFGPHAPEPRNAELLQLATRWQSAA